MSSRPDKRGSAVPRRRSPRLLSFIAIVVVTVPASFAAMLLAEWAARYREEHREAHPDAFPTIFYPHTRMRSGLVPNTDYFGWFKINSEGLRGSEFSPVKPDGTFRIVCLGASTTFDIGSVGTDLPWPSVLELELRERFPTQEIEVINCGVGGYTSLDAVINLQTRVLAYAPDLVIFYHAHNDLRYSIYNPNEGKKPGLYPFEQRPRGRLSRWLGNNSILYSKGIMKVHHTFGRRTRAEPITDFEARLQAGLDVFERNLNSVLAICTANEIDVIVPEVVIEYRESLPEAARETSLARLRASFRRLSTAQALEAYRRYNDTAKQLTNRYGKEFVLTSRFVSGGEEFFSDYMHFNGQGSRLMGTGLAGEVSQRIAEWAGRQSLGRADDDHHGGKH